MTDNEKVLAQMVQSLNMRGRQFTRHQTGGAVYLVQAAETCAYAKQPHRLEGLRFVIASALVAGDVSLRVQRKFKLYDVVQCGERLPTPVDSCELGTSLSGLGHVVAANRIEKLLDEMRGNHKSSGLDHA